MRRIVLDLADRRPAFRMPSLPDRVRAALGDGWDVRVVDAEASGVGDGAAAGSAAAVEAVADAEAYLGLGVPLDVLDAGSRLRWMHTGTAGVSAAALERLRERDVVLTNSAGVHGPPVAETAIAMMLHFARGLDVAVRAQARREWGKPAFDRPEPVAREIAGSTVGLIGYGGIGREVARRARALGARVVALRRGTGGAEADDEVLAGPGGLERALGEADYVVVCAPATPETRGMIDRAALDRMKPDAVLINVSRGALVDEAALIERLAARRLRGAGLDVFATEPLPESSPLWDLPNVLITPHVGGYGDRFRERESALVLDNVSRWARGEPLRNVVDPDRGY